MTIAFTSGRVSLYQVGPFGRADRGKNSPFELASGIELPQLVDRVVQVDLKYKSCFISIYICINCFQKLKSIKLYTKGSFTNYV